MFKKIYDIFALKKNSNFFYIIRNRKKYVFPDCIYLVLSWIQLIFDFQKFVIDKKGSPLLPRAFSKSELNSN